MRLSRAIASVVQQDEMRVAIKLLGMDAILHEDEFDIGDVEIRFLFYFAAQGVLRRLAPFDFAAGNAPEIGPFMGADHEHLAGTIENQSADGGNGRAQLLEIFRNRLEMQIVLLENLPQLTQMLDDDFRIRSAQLTEGIV